MALVAAPIVGETSAVKTGLLGRISGAFGPDKYPKLATNWWKPIAIGGVGAALGVGIYGMVRPTYDTGGGSIVNQNAQDPISGFMNSLMPLMMMGLMIPMMTNMMSGSTRKEKSKSDDDDE